MLTPNPGRTERTPSPAPLNPQELEELGGKLKASVEALLAPPINEGNIACVEPANLRFAFPPQAGARYQVAENMPIHRRRITDAVIDPETREIARPLFAKLMDPSSTCSAEDRSLLLARFKATTPQENQAMASPEVRAVIFKALEDPAESVALAAAEAFKAHHVTEDEFHRITLRLREIPLLSKDELPPELKSATRGLLQALRGVEDTEKRAALLRVLADGDSFVATTAGFILTLD